MNYVKIFSVIKDHCLSGQAEDIDRVMKILNDDSDLPITRAGLIDWAQAYSR